MLLLRPLASARTMMDTFTAVDATAPKPVRDAYTTATRIIEAGRNLGQPPEALARAVHRALAEGDDPAGDPQVQAHVAAQALANPGIGQAVEEVANTTLIETVAAHVDELVTIWREPFDAAAADLRAAHATLGDVNLDDAAGVLVQGPAAADAWARANNAVTAITKVLAGWDAMVRLTRTARADDQAHRALRMVEATPEQWLEHQLAGTDLDPWAATRLGLSLRLPTPQQYTQDVQKLADAQLAAERKAAAAREGKAFREGVSVL